MPETIFHRIAGALTLAGSAPDGDSLRFHAQRTRDLTRLADGGPLALAVDGGVQLRLEGLDAPELHYRGASQPHGHAARDELLAAVGVAHVAWKRDRVTAREATPPAIPATILAAACDPHGRPIAYLFTADAARDVDALPAHARALHGDARDDALLRRSRNADLLRTGAVFPLLYDTQPQTHRALFAKLARRARDDARGLWPLDRTAHGLPLDERARTPRAPLVWPKLFRRVVDYLGARAQNDVGSLHEWLTDPLVGATHDDRFLLPDGTALHFSDALRLGIDRAGLTLDPCDTVCVAKRAAKARQTHASAVPMPS